MYQGITKNVPLKKLTTMGVGGSAKYYIHTLTYEDLIQSLEFAKEKKIPVFVLGGGSNVIISDKGFDGLVVNIGLTGRLILEENNDFVILKISAGENWDKLVERCVEKGLWGIENLSLIPGSVGASVVQNVSAYGQEISDVLEYVEVLDTVTMNISCLSKKECKLSYRKSIFNSTEKDRYIIINIVIKLKKIGTPNISYKDFSRYFLKGDIPSISSVRKSVLEIRNKKLPDPEIIGSTGSFFKSIILTADEYFRLLKFTENKFHKSFHEKLCSVIDKFANSEFVKVPAGLLIDICDLKNLKVKNAAIYEKHSLIIVNRNGKATASDILALAQKIRVGVFKKTGLELEPEPVFVGFSDIELKSFYSM